MPNTAIGIVIPVHNCLELTKATVASTKTRYPFHLYFIDDHSNEETKEWLSSVPNATIFTDPEHSTGVAWNWNLGISAALIDGMTHVLIANNDIILHPAAIDAMARRINVGDAVLVSGLPVSCSEPEDVLSLDVTDTGDGGNADYSCFMITADTLKRAGWFDEHYRSAYCEDTDYRSTIYHFGEQEVCTHAAQYYHYVSSTIKQDAVLNDFIQDQANQNRGYFRSKWGCDPLYDPQEMNARYYPFPFNSQDRAVRKDEIPTARLADLYAAALEERSDISEHLSLLYKLASSVNHVTNISSIGDASATAFVQARPERCAIYCSLNSPGIVRLKCAAHFAGLDYIFAEFKRDIEIEQTDLLLIDAIHTEDVISCELSRYACRVKKYLIFHDTETFGLVGELPGSRGIWPAISNYMREHPEWQLLQHYSNCNGLTVFERCSVRNTAQYQNLIEPHSDDTAAKSIFERAVSNSSDISDHLWFLYHIGSLVNHITEMGTGRGNSTSAFIYARPRRLITYDLAPSCNIEMLEKAATDIGVEFFFFKQDVLTINIEPTDLLFIDTWHVEEQMREELARHADKVRKYIVMHDTETFGEIGETPGHRGIWPAVSAFIRSNPEWELLQHFSNNNGLTVLARRA